MMARRPDLGYFADGKDLLDPATYAEATAAFGEAKTLPATAFRALEFALLEDEAIWTRDWIAIGMSSDIPSDGDIMPFTAGNHGIHVQRMADGTLEGRFNNAQHGGCRFVPVQCQGGTKTKCSFSSCGYSRDRDAIPAAEGGYGVPAMHQYLGLRPERLLRVSVAELHGMILVNVDGPDKTLGFDASLSRHVEAALAGRPGRIDKRWMEFDCNWKTLAVALAASDGMPDTMPGALASQRLSASGERLSALWLFPNVVILSTEHASCLLVLQQTALERTLARIYSLGSQHGTSTPMLLDEVAAAAARAVAAQKLLAHATPADAAIQRDPVGYWMQTTLVRRLIDMPRQVHAAPMFQSTRHYAI
jgi:hypothetical protein